MNPSAPYSNPPFFNLLPQNPNPNVISNLNSNCNLFFSEHQNLPLQDLPSTLSSLNNLIQLSHQTLHSLSNLKLFETPNGTEACNLIPCSFNPHHRVPPHSLFRHSLSCSSLQPPLDPTHPLQTLHYPKTLVSSNQLLNENRFRQELPESGADLCFSLNDYVDFGTNFFYLDCPGAVSLSEQDGMCKIFTLPRILATECANFSGSADREMKGAQKECFRILPSELWALRSEVEAWNGYPHWYSYSVLCAILRSQIVRVSHLETWVIATSPRYGIVMDVALTGHILLLFKLCLKAIMNEALSFSETLDKRDLKEGDAAMSSTRLSFKCPILVNVLAWLASQLSILYGEMNGKHFAIELLKQCILHATFGLSFFPLEEENGSGKSTFEGSHNLNANGGDINDGKLEKSMDESGNRYSYMMGEETDTSGMIIVSQVAAAVAALHERSLLEVKIKGLRVSQPLTKYQRMAEHDYITRRADEERKKRPDYKPIIEHDGLPRHQSQNQEMNKTKTREELLAEERDYKRRRMSYRGKKVKRTTLQVMRDIIEEYMDEIKQAGGIGCFEKETVDRGGIPLKSSPNDDMAIGEPRKIEHNSSAAARDEPNQSRKQSNRDVSSVYFRDELPRESSHRDNEYRREERRRIGKDRHDEEYSSRSPETYSRHGRSHTHRSHHSDSMEATRTRRHDIREINSRVAHSHDNRSSSLSRSSNDSSSRKYRRESNVNDRWESNTFGDRYDPSESHDWLEYDFSCGSKDVRPDKQSRSSNDSSSRKYRRESNVNDRWESNTFGDRYYPSESHDWLEYDFSCGSKDVRPDKQYADVLHESSSGNPPEKDHSGHHEKS